MNPSWAQLLNFLVALSSLAGDPASYAKEILAPNVGSFQPGYSPGQTSQLGQLPVGDVSSESSLFRTPFLSGTSSAKAPFHLLCPKANSENLLSSRDPKNGLALGQACKLDFLPHSPIGQAGQRGDQKKSSTPSLKPSGSSRNSRP